MKSLTEILGIKEGQFFVRDNYVYVPLVVDGQLAQVTDSGEIRTIHGQKYVKSTNLLSVVENCHLICPQDYDAIKAQVAAELGKIPDKVALKDMLNEIIFQVLPHFVKINQGLERKKPTEDEIVEYLLSKNVVPENYIKRAVQITQDDSLNERLNTIGTYSVNVPNNVDTVGVLNNWFADAIKNQVLYNESVRIRGLVAERAAALKNSAKKNALFMYLNDCNAFDVDGFGFGNYDGALWAYKRIPAYALKDFNGDIYLFEGCRVAACGGSPHVMEYYKHPFLSSHRDMAQICIGHAQIIGDTRAERITQSIETGINVLLYGYFRHDGFGGYHSLNGRIQHGNYEVRFSDFKVSRDHPRIKSGEVIITNDALV